MLILSMFSSGESRVTTALATRRNEFVAALADDVWFAHIAEGGQMESLNHQLQQWNKEHANP